MFVLSVIRPDKTAVIYGTNPDPLSGDRSFSSLLRAAICIVSILRKTPGRVSLVEAKRFGLALAHASQQEPGIEHTQEETGLIFRIDPANTPPNVCPCCEALVRPDDHETAGQEDALCLGCFTWQRGVPQCLPANSAHPVPWVESGELFENAGDYGGDIQCGRAYGRRFHHTSLRGRVVNIVAYPVMGDDTTRDLPEGEIRLQWETETMVCRDVEDPGGTEVWSDVEYSDLPERFDFTWPTVGAAEAAARNLVALFDPAHIGWGGKPDFQWHTWPLHHVSSQVDDPVMQARRVVEWNNPKYGALLDWASALVEYPEGVKTVVAWVFDTRDMVNPTPDDPWSGPPPGGETAVVYWAPAPPDCDACQNYRDVPVHGSRDEILRHDRCPACSPANTTNPATISPTNWKRLLDRVDARLVAEDPDKED